MRISNPLRQVMRTFASGETCGGVATPMTNAQYIEKEEKCTALNYKPLPVVLARGEGVKVWDV